MFLILLIFGSLFSSVSGQAVYVDKVDYLPGDVVTLYGYSWQPGETVNVVVTETNLNPDGKLITTKSFSCNTQGKFQGTLYNIVEADLGAFFQVTATGEKSNHVCTTVFNDAGGDYGIDYSAYNPQYYKRYSPLNFPGSYPTGRTLSPLRLSDANSTRHDMTVESLNPTHLGLGQIVAFEFYISVDAKLSCTNDEITFSATWNTVTTNGNPFGFDPVL